MLEYTTTFSNTDAASQKVFPYFGQILSNYKLSTFIVYTVVLRYMYYIPRHVASIQVFTMVSGVDEKGGAIIAYCLVCISRHQGYFVCTTTPMDQMSHAYNPTPLFISYTHWAIDIRVGW